MANLLSGPLYRYATPQRLIPSWGDRNCWSIPDTFPFVRCVLELAIVNEDKSLGTWSGRSWGREGRFRKEALKILRVHFFRGVHFTEREECFQYISEGRLLALVLAATVSYDLCERYLYQYRNTERWHRDAQASEPLSFRQ